MFLIIFVFTAVLSAILPCVDTDAIHIIIDPLTLKLPPIQPGVRAEASDLILLPFAVVPRAIIPAVNAFSVLLSGEVLSLID